MERIKLLPAFVATLVLSLLFASPSMAKDQQTKTTFVRLGPGVPGVLYEPVTPGEKSQIGIFVMQSGGDYLTHSSCTDMSKRGYRVLCANNTTSKAGTSDDGSMDRMLLDAKLGVAYLRKYPGIRKVVLFGHSGGGALIGAASTRCYPAVRYSDKRYRTGRYRRRFGERHRTESQSSISCSTHGDH